MYSFGYVLPSLPFQPKFSQKGTEGTMTSKEISLGVERWELQLNNIINKPTDIEGRKHTCVQFRNN